MARIQTRLGNGITGDVEVDDFSRILNEQFYDYEEVRFLRPISYPNTFEYCGVAQSGSLSSNPIWTVLRKSYDNNGNPSRMQIRFNVIWDNVTVGWD